MTLKDYLEVIGDDTIVTVYIKYSESQKPQLVGVYSNRDIMFGNLKQHKYLDCTVLYIKVNKDIDTLNNLDTNSLEICIQLDNIEEPTDFLEHISYINTFDMDVDKYTDIDNIDVYSPTRFLKNGLVNSIGRMYEDASHIYISDSAVEPLKAINDKVKDEYIYDVAVIENPIAGLWVYNYYQDIWEYSKDTIENINNISKLMKNFT